jgi:hypothetical protein
VYAAVASFADPRWSPAFEVVDLQAHDSGRYYIKYSFCATWLLTIAVVTLAGALLWMLVRAVGALLRMAGGNKLHAEPPLPEGTQWSTLLRRTRARSGLIALALFAPSVPFLAVLFLDYEQLYPLGMVNVLLAVIAPMLYVCGQVLMLDALFLPQVYGGVIEKLELRHDQHGKVIGYDLASGGRRWSVPAKVYAQLQPGMTFALRAAHVTGSVLELRIAQSFYR